MVSSKARVALLDELSSSRSEISSLHSEDPINVHILGDSTCVISAINKVATSFNPLMHSRLADIHHTLDSIRKQADVMPIQYIPSEENIANIATRSETSLSMLRSDSLWQFKPHWLSLPRMQWPSSRTFTKEEILIMNEKSY